MFISIIGRLPGLSLAELEVLFGADKITRLSDQAALVDALAPDVDGLGGSIKTIDNVHKLSAGNWTDTVPKVTEFIQEHAANYSEGKVTVGLSVYGDKKLSPKVLQKYLINTKKSMRSSGSSVRVIPNKEIVLNSAQVLHNKLTRDKNIEIVLVKTSSGYWLGRTSGVQNIEALARRDQGRPKRDARVGMLPPKLALTMLNLASSSEARDTPGLNERKEEASNATKRTDEYSEVSSTASDAAIMSKANGTTSLPRRQIGLSRVVLDPFCGTGVVLQEALILGHDVYGTDLEQRMIDYSESNLDWIKNRLSLSGSVRLEQGDATTCEWKTPIDSVVSETYLGPPMTSEPSPTDLSKVKTEINSLIKSFLSNLAKQIEPGTNLCLAVPSWRIGGRFVHLNLLDDLEKLGYTRRVLKHATNQDLIYFRPGQKVARELLILTKK